MSDVSIWSILLLLTKLISYVAVATFIGGVLVTFLIAKNQDITSIHKQKTCLSILRWQQIWIAVALVIALLYLPLQAGSMADTGWLGMFDSLMLNIVWQSVLGTQTVWRIVGLLLALACLMWIPRSQINTSRVFQIRLLCGVILAGSFSLSGHPVELGLTAQILLSLHVFAMAAWAGSLWPLYVSCRQLPGHQLSIIMHNFGQMALAIVLLLLVCGGILLVMLLGSVSELFTTTYGQLLLLKLLLVTSMLLLGAWHKFSLVPKLAQPHDSQRLSQSIAIEGFIGISVLITTSILTTLVGPEMH